MSAITERRNMGLYEVSLSMYLLCFGMGTMLAICYMCGIMLVLRAVFNMLVRNASTSIFLLIFVRWEQHSYCSQTFFFCICKNIMF